MKLTAEQLSKVLTAHEFGGLKRGGDPNGLPAYPCCIVQAALEETSGLGHMMGSCWSWFDSNYEPSWTAAEFLSRLEAQGLA